MKIYCLDIHNSNLRKIKKLKYKEIYVAKIPNKEIGIAINDRLKRAAY